VAQNASESGLGVITRRIFLGGLAGACAAREHLVLEAVAAERMPHRIFVCGVEKSPFFELRNYGGAAPLEVFRRHGVRAVLEENGRVLFAFESLAARERAWREIGAVDASLKEIAVYRTI
jgi:hypothetical protein